jgi:hypothetical protein
MSPMLEANGSDFPRAGRTGRWTKIHPHIAPFSQTEALRHELSSADFTTNMFGFEFSVQTRP